MKRVLISLLAVTSTFAAEPIEQIRSLSGLPILDLDTLKRGEIVSARGPLGNFPRGAYVEACYFVKASVPTVGEKLLHWDTSKYAELEVSILREYTWPAAENAFDQVGLSSNKAKDKWLIDRTWQTIASGQPGELYVSANEAAKVSGQPPAEQRDAKVNEFWKKTLAARDKAISSGGLNALPRFSAASVDISIRGEFDGLMKLAPKIASHFQPLIKAKPFAAEGSPADEIAPYWQQSRVRGHTTLHGGFLAARKSSGSWQVADCTYFSSDTYFMSVTLFELLPVGDGTLVWQIDFVSAPFKPYLGGTDRFFAGKEMIKGTAKTIGLFRRHVEKP